jgi:acetylornithine/N-succinyldiaminopimelate aminotransferase
MYDYFFLFSDHNLIFMTEREMFFRYLGLPSFNPIGLEVVKADGVFLYDKEGRDFIDLVAGITVSNVGHRHPKVIEAITSQINDYLHTNVYGEFIHSPQVRLAKLLTELLPSSLDSVYFVNSGSEAVEGAVKLAKRYSGRSEIISFINSYHGSTHGALSFTGNETLKRAYRPLLPGVKHIEYNNIGNLGLISKRTACVVAESVQAEAGMILPAGKFLKELSKRCRETGTLLVLDDVQMGMGRTGRFSSFEHFDFIPDILVLAKALGAGMPLGAFISGKKIMDQLAFDPELGHITTFGGHPVSCAAGLAGLEVLCSGQLLKSVEAKGLYFEKFFSANPGIDVVRRIGLGLGIGLADPSKRKALSEAAIAHGIIIDWFLFRPSTFRIAPPLTITESEIDESVSRLSRAMKSAGI